MSKAVGTDRDFDNNLYSEVLLKAKGGRTQKEFADACGLSLAYICKHLNKKLDKAPIPSTLRKIADAGAVNGVTYADLLEAAGYDSTKYISSTSKSLPFIDSNSNHDNNFKEVAEGIITRSLFRKNLVLSSTPSDKSSFYDLQVEIQNNNIDRWCFKFIHSASEIANLPGDAFANRLYAYYGYISTMAGNNRTHVTFVTDSTDVYDFYTSTPPLSLASVISIILVDTNSFSILKEEYVRTGIDATEDSLITLK